MLGASVYLNGKLAGFHKNPQELAQRVRQKRRAAELPFDMSVAYYADLNEVYINTDANRPIRPLIVVDKGKSKLTDAHLKLLKDEKLKFSDLVKNGVIEFLDAEEEENARIAMEASGLTEEHSHLEIHPALIFGTVCAISPFPEYNHSPRVTMATQMIKQSLGLYSYNFNLRTDTNSHVLLYPQVPLAHSKFFKHVGAEDKASGQNFVVAIMSFYGYNINDALVINKSAVERGLGRSVYYRTYEAEERKYSGGQKDKFERPKTEIQGYRGDDAYKYLDEQGIIEPEFHAGAGDVLVGKTSPPRFLEEVSDFGVIEEKRRENSETLRHGEEGTVDWVVLTEGEGGNKLAKVRMRNQMIPETGDKLAARHGQKGVIGLLANETDMPFTENGIIPDLCLNPHAIPSRTTVGYLLECLGAKAGALSGREIDSTPFDGEQETDLAKELKSHGFKSSGRELMYDGVTGEPMEAQIFTGIVYYQRLKHLVANKIHARARGPVQILTRQPTEGRAREGGLRFGEMERDCLIGHGTAMVLTERLLEESDKVTELVCEKCGMIAIDDQIRKKKFCQLDGESIIHPVEMSYAFKLLLNELKAMCLSPKIKLADKV